MPFKHIDRLLIVGYFKSYVICLVSLLTLYVVVDLFLHLDDFVTHNAKGLPDILKRIGCYYGFRVPQFFDRLCEAIVLLAAMFTVAMMQRNNEQLPLLSAGVSTHRIVAPVLLSALLHAGADGSEPGSSHSANRRQVGPRTQRPRRPKRNHRAPANSSRTAYNSKVTEPFKQR